MPNLIFQNLLKSDIEYLVKEAKSVDKICHNGFKGSIREHGVGKLIAKYLPSDWEIGKGQIQDFKGNQSAETDLVIYNKNIIPPVLFGGLSGLFPVESVFYAFEVKTRSTASEIKTTIEKFNSLKKLTPVNKTVRTRTVYFALSSDLQDPAAELERYKKYDPQFYTDPAILILCVLGQGYWYYQQGDKAGVLFGYWSYFDAKMDNFELGLLLGGIINTLNAGKPQFGYYILPEGSMSIVDEAEIPSDSL